MVVRSCARYWPHPGLGAAGGICLFCPPDPTDWPLVALAHAPFHPRTLAPSQGEETEGWQWQAWRPGLWAAGAIGMLWLASLAMLWAVWKPGVYLGLELGWFLPPIILQVVVGADILWQKRQLALAALLPPVAYLAATDAFAIVQGTWTIDPRQTLGVLLGGVFPFEELIFFTLTNVLIVFGLILIITIRQGRLDANARLAK